MRATISSKGQIVIPKPVRKRQKIHPGDKFHLFELSNGDIMLRRVAVPKKSLVWHMQRLRAIIEHSRETIREVRW
ncbi:MAG: prlF antitoxin for toxin YhaV toxin [Pedosphaera sp.]|nr:prlF antitoxin for toxin YhaV toxin [Pedosphaera sp.]